MGIITDTGVNIILTSHWNVPVSSYVVGKRACFQQSLLSMGWVRTHTIICAAAYLQSMMCLISTVCVTYVYMCVAIFASYINTFQQRYLGTLKLNVYAERLDAVFNWVTSPLFMIQYHAEDIMYVSQMVKHVEIKWFILDDFIIRKYYLWTSRTVGPYLHITRNARPVMPQQYTKLMLNIDSVLLSIPHTHGQVLLHFPPTILHSLVI